MNFNAFLTERVLKQLNIPESSLKHFLLASELSNVEGRGFPKELFLLSAPMISRGLLNYGLLQMKRDWIFPFWVHKQLDPKDPAFIPRSQNPLLMNLTHRNWTALGTPKGYHEAVVDPRGLVTPLPREWSLDSWLFFNGQRLFPSLVDPIMQSLSPDSPHLTTRFRCSSMMLSLDTFVSGTRTRSDVVFHRAVVKNMSPAAVSGTFCFAVRPFNPEGVGPVESLEFRSSRHAYVNNAVGVVFAEDPTFVALGNSEEGDSAQSLGRPGGNATNGKRIACRQGLANGYAGFQFELEPGAERAFNCSIALADEKELRKSETRLSWKIPFEKRQLEHQVLWTQELSQGSSLSFADDGLQQLFNASRLALLQLHDGPFVSPGPFLYHHFWFRDAVLMLRALDAIGYPSRVRQTVNEFPVRLTQNGFFRGPDGEWDSNGAVLWSVLQHFMLTRSALWLRGYYPDLRRAAQWIIRMRRKTKKLPDGQRGLLPRSLSAEHLGTVDQYYWDAFWSLAGLQAIESIATEIGEHEDSGIFGKERREFHDDIMRSLDIQGRRLGKPLIPASPTRPFDEGAIGSICSVYPLRLFPKSFVNPYETVKAIIDRFVDDRGFFHPLIHSGYNPYLTMQLAHACLLEGDFDLAWKVADTMFRQSRAPFSFPEAIHPGTGGGSMGDGHHGWAAAEMILFLRDCLVREEDGALRFFEGAGRLFQKGKDLIIKNLPTQYGSVGCTVTFESGSRVAITFRSTFFVGTKPSEILFFLPFKVIKVTPVRAEHLQKVQIESKRTVVGTTCDVTTFFVDME